MALCQISELPGPVLALVSSAGLLAKAQVFETPNLFIESLILIAFTPLNQKELQRSAAS